MVVQQPIFGWMCVRPSPLFFCVHKLDNNHTQRLHFCGTLIDLEIHARFLEQDAESDAAKTSADNNDLGFLGDWGHCLN